MKKQKTSYVFGAMVMAFALTACGQTATETVLPLTQLSVDEITVTQTATGEYEAQAVVTNHADEAITYVNYEYKVDGQVSYLELVDGIMPGETKPTTVDHGPSSGDVTAMQIQVVTVRGFENGVPVTVMQDYVTGQTVTIQNPSQVNELDESDAESEIVPVGYEVVEESTLLSSNVTDWINRWDGKQGTDGFNDRNGGWTYLLMSAGETTSATAEIKLHGFERQGNSSLITYEVINEGDNDGVMHTPKLIVRVPLQQGWRTDFKRI